MVKNPPARARGVGDLGSTPGSGRSSGEGNGNPLQYWEIPWTEEPGGLHGIAKSLTRLRRLSTRACNPRRVKRQWKGDPYR